MIPISILIAIIYNFLVYKISEIMTKDAVMNEKLQNGLVVNIIGGIAAIALAFIIFDNQKLKNKTVRNGLAFSGALLILYSFICNWESIDDKTKMLLTGGFLVMTILYSYR